MPDERAENAGARKEADAGKEFVVETMVSGQDRLPYVTIRLGTEGAQIAPGHARFLAGMILEAATTAETDAIVFSWLQEAGDLDEDTAGAVLMEFRAYRDRLAGRKEAVCRGCGCTDSHGCALGCHWVEEDLCSTCHERGAP